MITDPILAPATPARRTLAHVWSGDEVVILSSPPGAGKTEAITSIAPYLDIAAGRSVTIATPTIAGAYDLAVRLKEKVERLNDEHGSETHVVLVGGSFNPRKSHGVAVEKSGRPDNGKICVRTIAATKLARSATDVLIVDEAYQSTALDVREAAAYASQVLLVGDPGQIGPVITIDTIAWDSLPDSPALRAPEMFETWPDAVKLHLETTFRLGPTTTQAIQCLYDFPFTSSRPDAKVEGLPEIEVHSLGSPTAPADLDTMREVVRIAEDMVGREYSYGGKTREITPKDIAIIASRNEQVSMLESLAARQLRKATVGTADSLQGGQWPIAVAVDPLLGAHEASGHALTQGRLCVMCSRHIGHLAFITSDDVNTLLDEADITKAERALQRRLREELMQA